jgi:hypothetical protein
MSIVTNANQLVWTPEASEPPLYYTGPSHNGLVEKGDDNSAQFIKSGMGSALYFGDANAGQKISFVVKKVGSTAQFYHPTFTPKAYIDSNGKITLSGTATLGGTSLTATHFLAGKPSGDCMYVVLDITNNSGISVDIVPALILADFNLQNFRWKDVGVSGDDTIAWDSTNKYLQVTSSGISNMYVGVKACTETQHFDAQANWQDVAAILASGDLDDTVGTTGQNNYMWVEYGETANPTAIAAGATARFVWAIAYKSTEGDLQTLMGGLTANPDDDLTAADGYFTKTRLRLTTPDQWKVGLLWDINLGRLGCQMYSQVIGGKKNIPAGSYTFIHPFGRDGYYSAKAALQIADGKDVVKEEYELFKANEAGNNSQMHEVAMYVNGSGLTNSASNNGAPGDQDPYQILKAYEYYVATQDGDFLTAEIDSLNEIYSYLKTYYDGQSKWNSQFPGHGTSTYLDGDGNITGENPMHDPVLSSLVAYSMYRLAELNTIEGNTEEAAAQTAFADSIKDNFESFWNETDEWLYFNIKTDGTTYDNIHLTKVDAGLWGILDEEKCKAMCDKIMDGETFWDDTNKQFRLMPTTDSLYNASSYWYGNGWNMVDFKALEFVFRYGTRTQAQTAWQYLKDIAPARISKVHGFLAEKWDNSGLFGFSIGAMEEMIVRGLFGIDAHADHFTINPNINKLNKDGLFKLTNLRMGNHVYTVIVRGSGTNKSVYINGALTSDEEIEYPEDGTIEVVYGGRRPIQ